MRTGLQGKTALITGASRGIGRATAFALAAEGANVVLSSRKQDALDEVAKEIRAQHPGVQVLAKAANVGDEEQARACIQAAIDQLGSLDVLVNNAGTSVHFGPMVEIDARAAAKTVQVNQFSVVLWTQLAWKLWMKEHGRAIINMASVGGMVTEHGIRYYHATKAAGNHLTPQFAIERAPSVPVHGITPAPVHTHPA